jgi:nuclear transport factor 2 (NTF2) superfamily protein
MEDWIFAADGLMHYLYAQINDREISEPQRLMQWPLWRRPDDHQGLSELGLLSQCKG